MFINWSPQTAHPQCSLRNGNTKIPQDTPLKLQSRSAPSHIVNITRTRDVNNTALRCESWITVGFVTNAYLYERLFSLRLFVPFSVCRIVLVGDVRASFSRIVVVGRYAPEVVHTFVVVKSIDPWRAYELSIIWLRWDEVDWYCLESDYGLLIET